MAVDEWLIRFYILGIGTVPFPGFFTEQKVWARNTPIKQLSLQNTNWESFSLIIHVYDIVILTHKHIMATVFNMYVKTCIRWHDMWSWILKPDNNGNYKI